MNRNVFFAAALLVALGGALLAQSQPVLSSISPTQTTAGAPAFTMTLNGTGFVGGTIRVNFGSNILAPITSASTVITVQIPSALLVASGTVDVSVTVAPLNTAPITSASRPFAINPAPAIATTSPLPSGVLGSPYFQALSATGGTPALTWSVVSGTLPPGLTLSPGSGTMTGTPTNSGAYRFTARVTDSQGLFADRTFNLNIAQSGTTQGPDGTVGVAYSATLVATSGTGPWSWAITSGQLPPGLNLNAVNGIISGIPTAAGTFVFVAQWTDSQELVFPNTFSIRILPAPALTITTSSLPNATAGSAYSQTFAATGGSPPYTWSVSVGSLQSGLTLSAAGVLSGTPTQGGTSNFTVRVADAQGVVATKVFTLAVTVPPATLSITGLTDIVSPALQPTFDVQLSAAYPLTITGTITLTFRHNAIYASDDPAIQFSSGGRTLNFTIAAGQTRAFPATLPSIQTGTVAGQIDLTIGNLFAGGQNITPANPPVRSMTIARAAPKINSVQVVKTGSGFNILVSGYSTPRQVVQADFTFTPASGANVENAHVTVIVDPVFTIWYTGTTSPQYGSQFLYTQPFTVQGDVSDLASVSVTLAHSTGTSAAVSASF